MRERHLLQDRIELLGPIRPSDVRNVLIRGHIFLNASLTESFGIALVEAACAGLHVVSTRVGGVPEVLPPDMITFARPDEGDVLRACIEAVRRVREGEHDPARAHERVRGFYGWEQVAERTERVYERVIESPQKDFWTRLSR
jgi:phosphatidylinositol glycan class A protein